MKSVFFAMLALVSVSAAAYARPDTTRMTCRQAADLVAARGAVVLTYGHHEEAGALYDRFVSSSYYCGNGETVRPAWVRTKDSAACYIGGTCQYNTND